MTQNSGLKNMIDILQVIPGVQLDIRYATNNNFLGHAVYSHPICYLHKEAANALRNVYEELLSQKIYLKLFDGYRPLSVQQYMWDIIQDERYISNPAVNKGRHTRGTAIDLTLIDAFGNELEMPSAFDDFSELAHSDFEDVSNLAKTNRLLLKTVMERNGFIQLPFEWWHFDLAGWKDDIKFPPMDVTFEDLIKPSN